MTARTPLVKRYVVRLSAEERHRLKAMIHKDKSSAARLLKARILLKTDVSKAGEGWSDSRIVEAPTECAGGWWRKASRRF